MSVVATWTWMWQGLVVAGVAALLAQAIPRLNAATRHAIWWISLVMVLIHPWTPSRVPSEINVSAGPEARAFADTFFFLPMPPHWVMLGVVAVWMCLVGWRTWQIARGVAIVAQLKRQSCAFAPGEERRLRMWQSTRGVGRACELRISDRCAGACALGFWRPVILIPRCLIQALSDEELDQVVMHERAHLMRYDDWSRLTQCVVEAIVGLHPAVWFIGNQIDLERETACDDQVVALTMAPRSYAACLAHVAGILTARQGQAPSLAPAATRRGGMLQSRVARLLDSRRNGLSHFGWLPTSASLVILAAVVAGSDQLPPFVAFATPDAYVDTSAEELLPVLHPTTAAVLALPIVPPPPVAAAKRPSALQRYAEPAARAVRATRPPFALVRPAGTKDKGLPTPGNPPILLDSSSLSGGADPTPVVGALTLSEPTSNEPSDGGSPLAAVGSLTARTAVAAAARTQHLGVGLGGWFARKATAVGHAF